MSRTRDRLRRFEKEGGVRYADKNKRGNAPPPLAEKPPEPPKAQVIAQAPDREEQIRRNMAAQEAAREAAREAAQKARRIEKPLEDQMQQDAEKSDLERVGEQENQDKRKNVPFVGLSTVRIGDHYRNITIEGFVAYGEDQTDLEAFVESTEISQKRNRGMAAARFKQAASREGLV